jgi:hypothetical protein
LTAREALDVIAILGALEASEAEALNSTLRYGVRTFAALAVSGLKSASRRQLYVALWDVLGDGTGSVLSILGLADDAAALRGARTSSRGKRPSPPQVTIEIDEGGGPHA